MTRYKYATTHWWQLNQPTHPDDTGRWSLVYCETGKEPCEQTNSNGTVIGVRDEPISIGTWKLTWYEDEPDRASVAGGGAK